MEHLVEIVKYISPFIGVIIGWFLSRINERNRIKYEEQKRVKRVLFVLLEIRNELLQSKKMDKYLQIYIDKVKVKFNIEEFGGVDSIELLNALKELLTNMIKDSTQFDLRSQFDECVDNLSEIVPFLAYRINGKQNIKYFIENWENETKKMLASENINEVENMLSHFKPKLVNEIQNDLSEIIIEVADLTNDNKLKEDILECLNELENPNVENDIAEYIDKMFDGIE